MKLPTLVFIFLATATQIVLSTPTAGNYLLITDDGNLHAQESSISKNESECYFTIKRGDFLPETKSIKIHSISDYYRVVISSDQISSSPKDIDVMILTLRPTNNGRFWGNYYYTTKEDNKIDGKLLLVPIRSEQDAAANP